MAKPRKSWKRKTIIALLVALVAVPVVAVFVIKSRSEKAWTDFVTKWEARGEDFGLEPQLPKKVPDSENLVLHPLFGDGVNGLGESAACQAIQPSNLPGWDEDAYHEYHSDPGASGIAEWFGLPKGMPAAEVATRLGEPYRNWSEGLDRVAAALHERQNLQFEIDWDNFFITAEVPEFAPIQTLGNSMLLRATMRRAAGDGAGAAHDLVSILRLARAISRTPLLIIKVIEAGLSFVALEELKAGLRAGLFGETELTNLAQELSKAPSPTEGLLQALRMERALLLNFLDHLAESSNSNAIDALGSPSTGLSMFLIRIWMPANRLALCQDQQEIFLGPGGHYADLARWDDAVQTRLDSGSGRFIAPVGHLLLGAFGVVGGLGGVAYECEANLNHARIALALERFRLAEGSPPDQLTNLIPSYLPALPDSIFDGSPIRYSLRPDGSWRLWQSAPRTDPNEWESK